MAQAEEKGWSLEILNKALASLESKNRLNQQEIMQYVVTPYVSSLGYNIFDIDEVDNFVDNGTTVIRAIKDVSIVLSLNEEYPFDDHAKIFIHLDVDTKNITMFLKAFNDWESLITVNIKNKEDNANYQKLKEYIYAETLRKLYASKSERLFTESVLRRKLANDEYDNVFVREVIKDELKNPSKLLLQVLAQGLNKKFSTDSTSTITNGLSGIQKTGIVDLFEDVIMEIRNTDGYDTAPKPKVYSKPEKEVVEEKTVYQPPIDTSIYDSIITDEDDEYTNPTSTPQEPEHEEENLMDIETVATLEENKTVVPVVEEDENIFTLEDVEKEENKPKDVSLHEDDNGVTDLGALFDV